MNSTDDKKSLDRHLRKAAESQLANSPRASVPVRWADVQLHELQVYQIELEMQNEALRQAQIALTESRDRYVDLYEFAPVGYLTLTPEGLIAEINLTSVKLLGKERKNLLQKRFSSLVMPEDANRWTQHLLRMKSGDANGRVELALRRADGTVFQAQIDCLCEQHAMRSENPGVTSGASGYMGVRIVLTDITERKRAEEELRIAAVAFAAQNAMLITDTRGVILRVNEAFTHLTGYSTKEAIGRTPALLRSGRQAPQFYRHMWDSLKAKGVWQGAIWNKHKNGQIFAEMLTITAVISPELGATHFIGSYSNITEDKEAEAEIHRLAFYDPLTRLPNRRLLQDRIGQAIAASAHSRLYGAIFFIDLDNFKALNDTRGHAVGDLLLIEVSQRMRAEVRECDMVARQGGDEFVVLMENLGAEAIGAAALANQLGDKLRHAIDRPFTLDGHEYNCMLSIGVGLFNSHETVEDLFKRADLALHQAKKSGRNTLRFFDPAMQAALEFRSSTEAELRQALKRSQLLLYYQPQVDVTGRVIGAEALLRWQHAERGMVMPNDFIPMAEETGLILSIGLWVLETACIQLKIWENDIATRELQLAVNISARQFRQEDFVPQVQGILESSGVNPARLKFELTESLVLEDIEGTIAKMQAIKRLGVSFAMDDFGTGYSSLSYLAQLPLDQLKIDRSFVRNLPGERKDETIAKTIITMGQGLAMDVIAEGVETEAQREFLEANDCLVYQGYLYSRPLPLREFEDFVKRV